MPDTRLIFIRAATVTDTPVLLGLCRQIGFDPGEAALQAHLRLLLGSPDRTVLVGVDESNAPLAWAALELRVLLEAPPTVEITGFVVDQAVRGQQVARRILAAAEGWALAHGVLSVSLRSSTMRHDAHHFYLRQGYCVTTTQHLLIKSLGGRK